jgi:hypothetical protein
MNRDRVIFWLGVIAALIVLSMPCLLYAFAQRPIKTVWDYAGVSLVVSAIMILSASPFMAYCLWARWRLPPPLLLVGGLAVGLEIVFLTLGPPCVKLALGMFSNQKLPNDESASLYAFVAGNVGCCVISFCCILYWIFFRRKH